MAVIASSSATRWLIDRQFSGLTATTLVAGFILTSLPVGLVFDPDVRAAIENTPGAGSGYVRATWLPLVLASIWILANRLSLALSVLRGQNPLLWLLIGWAFTTSLWAPDTLTAFKQVVIILGTSLLATAFTLASWQPGRLAALLRYSTTVLLLASLLTGLLFPRIGIHHESNFELNGSWRGVTYQKNGLGQLAAVGLILWTHAWASRSTSSRAAIGGIGLSILMTLLSRSSTSLLVALISIAGVITALRAPMRLGMAVTPLRLSFWFGVVLSIGLFLMVVGAVDYDSIAEPFGELFGKDATFSGRTLIWNELFREIAKHPWAGIGFNSFWAGGVDGPAAEAIRRLQWVAPNGHEGYLDMINEIGLIGFLLLIGFLVLHFRQLRQLRDLDRSGFALHRALMIYVLLANLTETGWFHPVQLTHVLAMYSSAEVSRRLFELRLRAMQPILMHAPA